MFNRILLIFTNCATKPIESKKLKQGCNIGVYSKKQLVINKKALVAGMIYRSTSEKVVVVVEDEKDDEIKIGEIYKLVF